MGGSKKNDEESLVEAIKFYQNGLIRYLERNDEIKMTHSLNKLSSYPIRVRHLKETGVGRTVNLLSQKEGKVGEQARSLIIKWKLMVEQEEPKQKPEPSAEAPQKSPQQDSRYKPEDHKSSSEKSYNKYNSSEDENDMKLDSTGEDTRGSESSVSEEDKIYNSAKKHGSSHSRDDKTSSKHRSGEKEHSSHNKYSKHENHHSSKHDKEHSSRRQKEHSSKYDKSSSSRNEIEESSKKLKEDEDIDSSNDKNNRIKHEKDVSSRHDKHSSRHDDKHSSKHNDKHSSRHDDKYSSKHEKENSSKIKTKDRVEKDDSRRKEDKRHKEKDSLDDKSYKSDRKGNDKERSHKESEKDNLQEKDEKRKKERDEKTKEYKNKIEENPIKDEDKKPKSVKRTEEKSSTKYYPKEISSGSGTSFEEALGMMEIPSKEKKSHTKESISKHKKSENHNSSKSPDNFEIKKSKTESDKKPKSSHKESECHKKDGSEKKSEKKDKPSSSRLYTDEIPSTSGTSFEDALGMMEIPNRERKGVKRKSNNYEDSEICSSSGTTFEEALGMVEVPRKKKKLTDRTMDTSPVPLDLEPLPVPLPSSPLERMDVAPMNLPQITPNYKPLLPVPDFPTGHHESLFVDNFMKNKNTRTKIYSGNKQTLNKVPSLLEICINLLQVHIDDMEATGGVPYYILKPVLEKATPNQLLRLEYFNSYLTEDTDELWELHCRKDFRNKQRQECESWREMYTRCVDEREARFLMLTASIKEAKKNSEPIRTTKIAYIDPPMVGSRRHRSIAVSVPTAKEKVAAIVRESKASADVVVTHQRRASRSHAAPSISSQSKVKKMAPLMAKSLSAFKNRRYKN